jgi:hypothetical protein
MARLYERYKSELVSVIRVAGYGWLYSNFVNGEPPCFTRDEQKALTFEEDTTENEVMNHLRMHGYDAFISGVHGTKILEREEE